MLSRTFHILTESEPFSEQSGGAISRWVANAVRADDASIVLAPSADATWRWNPSRIRVVTGLTGYKQFCSQGGHRLPWMIKLKIIARLLDRELADLKAGDTVWVHNRPEFALALQPFIAARGARLVLHLHNSHLVDWPPRIIRALKVDRYVFVSHYLQNEALNKYPDLQGTCVMHNGADGILFHEAPPERPDNAVPVVLFAGRLVPDKGVHIFMDAMDTLAARKVPIEGRVVGGAGFGASAPTDYVRKIQSRPSENVRLLPYCSGEELAEEFRSADIFCLPSIWQEPLGMAPIEAMASGVPVVVSRSGGMPELLQFGGGIAVERGSSDALADALQHLAINPALRRQLGKEALTSFRDNFTWDAVYRRYLSILNFDSSPADSLDLIPQELCNEH